MQEQEHHSIGRGGILEIPEHSKSRVAATSDMWAIGMLILEYVYISTSIQVRGFQLTPLILKGMCTPSLSLLR